MPVKFSAMETHSISDSFVTKYNAGSGKENAIFALHRSHRARAHLDRHWTVVYGTFHCMSEGGIQRSATELIIN